MDMEHKPTRSNHPNQCYTSPSHRSRSLYSYSTAPRRCITLSDNTTALRTNGNDDSLIAFIYMFTRHVVVYFRSRLVTDCKLQAWSSSSKLICTSICFELYASQEALQRPVITTGIVDIMLSYRQYTSVVPFNTHMSTLPCWTGRCWWMPCNDLYGVAAMSECSCIYCVRRHNKCAVTRCTIRYSIYTGLRDFIAWQRYHVLLRLPGGTQDESIKRIA
jgi:hypothetical protein